ncbi:MAG: tetratricopeptide repeat protein [bacterium]
MQLPAYGAILLPMAIAPRHSRGRFSPVSKRPFVGRDDILAQFEKTLRTRKPDELKVLAFHGVAGIGKTRLRQELARRLEQIWPGAIHMTLDFFSARHRTAGEALPFMRWTLKNKYHIPFPAFDLAYAWYWRRSHPHAVLNSQTFPLWEESGLLADLIAAGGEIPVVGFVPKAGKVVVRGGQMVKQWWQQRGQQDLQQLTELEAADIEERLPMFFAEDIKRYLATHGLPVVFFLDTYEELTGKEHAEEALFRADEWVRELAAQLPQELWVITGREELRWQERNADWQAHLRQYEVVDLKDEPVHEFLQGCGIEDIDIRQVIAKGSSGVPFYLHLSVDTYERIKENRQPTTDDFGKTQPEIFDSFTRHLNVPEIETLKVLSTARFWDDNLAGLLLDKFKTAYPETALPDLYKFSFVREGPSAESWTMHDLMLDSLQQWLIDNREAQWRQMHQFLLEHYESKFKGVAVKDITESHNTALGEAFFHATTILSPDELAYWLPDAADVFNDAAQWSLLVPMYHRAINLLENKGAAGDPSFATLLNNLAELYREQGKYAEAEPLYKRALKIDEKTLGKDHPSVATDLNNLAELYRETGKYAEAEPLYKRALKIDEKSLGKNHPGVATNLNNLATLYNDQGKYAEAEPLYKRALQIGEQTLGKDHPKVALRLNNLASLYCAQEKYTEAEPLFKRALQMGEQTLGKDHPNVAIRLNNLASLYYAQEKYTEAEPLYKRALEIDEKALGKDHPGVAIDLNNLANLYYNQGKYTEAEPLYKRALKIVEKALPPDHPHLAKLLENMAGLYVKMGNDRAVRKCAKRAAKIRLMREGADG